MWQSQPQPIFVPALDPYHPNPALLVFLHGFDDDAESYTSLAAYIQTPQPHLSILLPTAPIDHDSRARAWFSPRPFAIIPVDRSTSSNPTPTADTPTADTSTTSSPPTATTTSTPTPTADTTASASAFGDEDSGEDIKGLTRTCASLRAIIAGKVSELGIDPQRVIVAGFSQGGATSLALGLGLGLPSSPGNGDIPLAGVASLSGYLPSFNLPSRLPPAPTSTTEDRPGAADGSQGQTKFFLAHGTKDMLVPGWVARQTRARVEQLVGTERVQGRMYTGMGHGVRGEEVDDFGGWLGGVLGA